MKKYVVLLVLISLTAIAALPANAQRQCRTVTGRLILCPTNVMLTNNFGSGLDAVAFDPQPEPPSPGGIRGFDPQPDPPHEVNSMPGTGYEAVGFNPQPDPPHEAFVGR